MGGESSPGRGLTGGGGVGGESGGGLVGGVGGESSSGRGLTGGGGGCSCSILFEGGLVTVFLLPSLSFTSFVSLFKSLDLPE